MDDNCKIIELSFVTVQENGIIRNSEGYLIGRLVESVKFGSEYLTNNPDKEFVNDLSSLLNKHNKERGSDTPDFVLADYLCRCLLVYDIVVTNREKWTSDILKKIETGKNNH